MIPCLVKKQLVEQYGKDFILPDHILCLYKGKLAWQGTEHSLQREYFAWLAKLALDDPILTLVYAIPNGGERGKIAAANFKAEGVKAGTPDVCIPIPCCGYHGAYIEFKRSSKKPSEDQRIKILQLLELGYACLVINNLEAAKEWTKDYLGLNE